MNDANDRHGHDLADFLEEHGPHLFRVARRMLRDEEDARDAVQEVVLAVLQAPDVLTNLHSVGAWLVTLVRCRAIDLIRRERRERRDRAAFDRIDLDLSAVLGSTGASPADEAARRERIERVTEAVLALPPELREVVVENEFRGKPYREIAAETGTPMGTLMARKKRAVAVLARTLDRE